MWPFKKERIFRSEDFSNLHKSVKNQGEYIDEEKFLETYRQLLAIAENIREQGGKTNLNTAIDQFDQLHTLVVEWGSADQHAEVEGHRIVTFKRFFTDFARTEREKDFFARHWYESCNTIIAMRNISDARRSVGFLRKADYYLALGNTTEAEALYELAVVMTEHGTIAEVENLGHYAEGLAANGKPKEAMWRVEEAIGKAKHLQFAPDRAFHRATILCGLYYRLVATCLKLPKKNYAKIFTALVKSYSYAWIYFIRHGKYARLAQFHGKLPIIGVFQRELYKAN